MHYRETGRRVERHQDPGPIFLAIEAILILLLVAGCGPSSEVVETIDYAPEPGGDWAVSTPAEQGLEPALVAELYQDAFKLETLYGLLW